MNPVPTLQVHPSRRRCAGRAAVAICRWRRPAAVPPPSASRAGRRSPRGRQADRRGQGLLAGPGPAGPGRRRPGGDRLRRCDMEAALAGFDVAERAAVVPLPGPAPGRLARPARRRAGRATPATPCTPCASRRPPRSRARPSTRCCCPRWSRTSRPGASGPAATSSRRSSSTSARRPSRLLTPLLADPAVPFATPVEVIDKVAELPAKEEAGAALTRRARGPGPSRPSRSGRRWPPWAARTPPTSSWRRSRRAPCPTPSGRRWRWCKLRQTPGVGTFAVRLAAAASTAPSHARAALPDRGEGRRRGDRQGAARPADQHPRPGAAQADLRRGRQGADGRRPILPALEALPLDVCWDAKMLREDFLAPLAACRASRPAGRFSGHGVQVAAGPPARHLGHRPDGVRLRRPSDRQAGQGHRHRQGPASQRRRRRRQATKVVAPTWRKKATLRLRPGGHRVAGFPDGPLDDLDLLAGLQARARARAG